MKRPAKSSDSDVAKNNKEICVDRFKHWWPTHEKLRQIINSILVKRSTHSRNLLDIIEDNGKSPITNIDKLAELLYDVIGPHFLDKVYAEDEQGRITPILRTEILTACTENDPPDFPAKTIIDLFKKNIPPGTKAAQTKTGKIVDYQTVSDIAFVKSWSGTWSNEIVKWLELPPETCQPPPPKPTPPPFEEISPNREYQPLHDYQIAAGREIRNMLESENERKRLLISIPTGSGKTRLVVESLVDWLNKGKQISPPQQKNSKYILWVAQSDVLCEQAISSIKELYQQKGESAIKIWRLYGGRQSLSDIITKNDEQAIIVATIDSLYWTVAERTSNSELEERADDKREDKGSQPFYDHPTFTSLRNLTSCIIIDEGHRATTKMYTRFLYGMGFNFRKNEEDVNEKGIVLVGLTATPFRGKGIEGGDISKETDRMWKRFSDPHYPAISNLSDEQKPVPIIDCQRNVFSDSYVRISAGRSFDNNSVITNYKWTITYQPNLREELLRENNNQTPLPDPKPEKEIEYVFPKQGEYKITLTITNKEGVSESVDHRINVIIKEEKDFIVVNYCSKCEQERKCKNCEVCGNITIEKKRKKTGAEKYEELLTSLIDREILCDVFHAEIEGSTVTGEVKDLTEISKNTRKQLADNDNRNDVIWKTIDYFVHKCGRKKILVFACDIVHARKLAMVLRAKYNIKADFVDSNVPGNQRVEKIDQFDKGKIQVLCNVDILTTGFDVPDIDCVLVTRPAKSTVLYTQMIGRGMRGKKMGGTSDVWLIDLDDQIQLHSQFSDQVIDLGWKQFSKLWKDLSDCTELDGSPINLEFLKSEKTIATGEPIPPPKPKNPTMVEAGYKAAETSKALKELTHTCSNCGLVVTGINSLIDNFGYSDEDRQFIIDLFKNDKLDEQLEKLCSDCRKKKELEQQHDFVEPTDKGSWYEELQANIKRVGGHDWQLITNAPEYFILKNKNDPNNEKRIFVSYGNKQTEKEKVDVGIKDKAMGFLRGIDTSNSFVLVVNIGQKSYLTLPFKILEENGKFHGAGMWDKTGQDTMWFTVSTLTNDTAILSDTYDCSEYLLNLKQVFENPADCPYCDYMENQPMGRFVKNYQFEFALYLIECQKNNVSPTYDGIIAHLQKANPGLAHDSNFVPVFEVYKNKELVTRKRDNATVVSGTRAADSGGTYEINTKKILDLTRFEKLVEEKYQIWKGEQKEKEEGEAKIKEIQLKDELESHFQELCNVIINHIPTKREFGENTSRQLVDYMTKLYGTYRDFLESKNLKLSEDLTLRDLLYDEYFELYSNVRREITPSEIDLYEKWKITDYDEVFGSYDEFLKIVNPIIQRMEKIKDEDQKEFKELLEDYKHVTADLGHKPHFDELIHSSRIGIEYFLKEHDSYEHFKHVADMPSGDTYAISKLTSCYNDILRELGVQPSHKHLIDHCEYGERFAELFQSMQDFIKKTGVKRGDSYGMSLHALSKVNFSYDREVYVEKRNEMIEKSKARKESINLVNEIEFIISDKEIKYNEWFGDKEKFIEECYDDYALELYHKMNTPKKD